MVQSVRFDSQSTARNNSATPGAERPSGEDLSDWLQEVAKRPWISGPPTVNPLVVAEPGPEFVRQSWLQRFHLTGRDLAGLSALTMAYLQYYSLDVMVQIGGLPKVVVFVPMVVG
jgi:hypothetical protein